MSRPIQIAYQLGQRSEEYLAGRSQYCTLVVTEQCNLRCKYCYQLGKNATRPMSEAVALRAIDFILDMPVRSDGLVLEFTGGECTLELNLIRKVIRYFKRRMLDMPTHPWRSSHTFMLSSNGILYNTPEVQRLVWENRGRMYVAITIDGTKRKHDKARVFLDGTGSYDIVSKSVKKWVRQFPDASTKITFSSEDLPYVCESILHVWDLGVRNIAANVVFENVWQAGDPEVFEEQLRQLADIALERGLWRTNRCTLFWEPSNAPMKEQDDRNWCGCGRMLSVDATGHLFPCLRFQDFCMSNRCGRSFGDIWSGFKHNLIRPFYCLRKSLQSPVKCMQCEMQDQCSWCTAHNYDAADSDTMFQRADYICEMHKARYRANQYYWKELAARHGVVPSKGEQDSATIVAAGNGSKAGNHG